MYLWFHYVIPLDMPVCLIRACLFHPPILVLLCSISPFPLSLLTNFPHFLYRNSLHFAIHLFMVLWRFSLLIMHPDSLRALPYPLTFSPSLLTQSSLLMSYLLRLHSQFSLAYFKSHHFLLFLIRFWLCSFIAAVPFHATTAFVGTLRIFSGQATWQIYAKWIRESLKYS